MLGGVDPNSKAIVNRVDVREVSVAKGRAKIGLLGREINVNVYNNKVTQFFANLFGKSTVIAVRDVKGGEFKYYHVNTKSLAKAYAGKPSSIEKTANAGVQRFIADHRAKIVTPGPEFNDVSLGQLAWKNGELRPDGQPVVLSKNKEMVRLRNDMAEKMNLQELNAGILVLLTIANSLEEIRERGNKETDKSFLIYDLSNLRDSMPGNVLIEHFLTALENAEAKGISKEGLIDNGGLSNIIQQFTEAIDNDFRISTENMSDAYVKWKADQSKINH